MARVNPTKVEVQNIEAILSQLKNVISDLEEAVETMTNNSVSSVTVHYFPTAVLGLQSLSRFAGQCRTQANLSASLRLAISPKAKSTVVQRMLDERETKSDNKR